MAVIVMASSKGGCGKSTLTISLAGAMAEKGYEVRIVDADPAQRVYRWAADGTIPDNITVSGAEYMTLVKKIEEGEREADIVLVDVEGSANGAILRAISYADFVLIPAQPSAADVEEAIRTVQIVREQPRMKGGVAPMAMVWTRLPTGFASREFVSLAEQVEAVGVPVIGRTMERNAYKALISFGTTLERLDRSEVGKVDKAIAETNELAAAIEAEVLKAKEAA